MKTWKLLLCLAVMALLLGGMGASAEIVGTGTAGSCTYKLYDDGLLTIEPTDGVSGNLPNREDLNRIAFSAIDKNEVIKIEVLSGVKTTYLASALFYSFPNLVEADLNNLDVSAVELANYMFENCSNLETVKAETWDLSNMKQCIDMFRGCKKLKNINTANWKILTNRPYSDAIHNLQGMFDGCESLETIDVSTWVTKYVDNASRMFRNCKRLKTIKGGLVFENVGSIWGMFSGCESLETLDVSNWKMGNLRRCDRAFYNCSALKTLDVSKWGPSLIGRYEGDGMKEIFAGCSNLIELDLSTWSIHSKDSVYTPNTSNIFDGDTALKKLVYSSGFKHDKKSTFPVSMYELSLGDDPGHYRYYQALTDAVPDGEGVYVVGWKITFAPNGGQGDMAGQEQVFGYSFNAKKLRENAFTRDGFVFTGWNTKANGSGTAYDASDLLGYDSFSGDITLYAQWAPKPTVPKTGDTARPALYLAFVALSALALLALGRKHRRAEK